MSKSKKWAIASASFCAVIGALDFTIAALTGNWLNYAFGGVMVACLIPNLYLIRQRKAESAVANNSYLHNYLSGGYIAPLSTPQPTSTPSSSKQPDEFKGLPFDFAVGEVYGLRMWRMDQYGRLRARNWDNAEPWRPGVNQAKCVERGDDPYAILRSFSQLSGISAPPPKPPKPPHDAPSENCSCGFYAYTESRHAETLPYKDSHVVLGIVKGTGRTLMGTKGFRCEKAEIIALRDPTRGGTKNDPWRVEQLANLKRVYPDVPLLDSREALLEFAPLTNTMPDPSTDEFWALP